MTIVRLIISTKYSCFAHTNQKKTVSSIVLFKIRKETKIYFPETGMHKGAFTLVLKRAFTLVLKRACLATVTEKSRLHIGQPSQLTSKNFAVTDARHVVSSPNANAAECAVY